MNHEILFRGFHPREDGDTTIWADGKAVKGRWVEGAYCKLDDKQNESAHIISYEKDDTFGDWVDVIPSTVGQYTGLPDKNGKKIFKGDIVTADDYLVMSEYDGRRFQVTFLECGYYLEPKGRAELCIALYNECAEYEVIGTIFDKED